jgi:hypothetical protein
MFFPIPITEILVGKGKEPGPIMRVRSVIADERASFWERESFFCVWILDWSTPGSGNWVLKVSACHVRKKMPGTEKRDDVLEWVCLVARDLEMKRY